MDVYTERAANAIYEERYRPIVEGLRENPGAAAAAWAVLRRRAMREAEEWGALGDRLSEPWNGDVCPEPSSED